MGDTRTPDDQLAAGDAHGLLRACHSRRLEREGIPMFIGLVDERGAIPANADTHQTDAGAAVAELTERYYRELVPFARPDDEGALITAMQVVAYGHLAPTLGSPASRPALAATAPDDGGIAEGVRV